jgi:hypothetical protein
MQKFKPVIKDQLFLLPPGIEDFVPAGHLSLLAFVVRAAGEKHQAAALKKMKSKLELKTPKHTKF